MPRRSCRWRTRRKSRRSWTESSWCTRWQDRRGVLKRAKSNLDNVDAKVLGVVLNNVKPEAVRTTSATIRTTTTAGFGGQPSGAATATGQRLRWPNAMAKALGLLSFFVVLSLFALGVFWQELPTYLPEWLLPYAQALFTN